MSGQALQGEVDLEDHHSLHQAVHPVISEALQWPDMGSDRIPKQASRSEGETQRLLQLAKSDLPQMAELRPAYLYTQKTISISTKT